MGRLKTTSDAIKVLSGKWTVPGLEDTRPLPFPEIDRRQLKED